jgi:fluoride exporter
MLRRYLLIAVGGALGAILRYAIGSVAAQRYGTRFPVGTLTINLTACFLIGLILEFLNRHAGMSAAWRYLIPIGFIGAYSTFSTFEYEMWTEFTRGAYLIGVLYLVVSLVGGFIAVGLGVSTARAIS